MLKARARTEEERKTRNEYLRNWRAKKKESKKTKSLGAATQKRKLHVALVAAKVAEKPSLSVGEAIREVGLSEHLATHPSKLTETKEWSEMVDEYLPNVDVLATHKGLLRASNLDHMSFIAEDKVGGLTDDDIHAMFTELNCKVRKIIHRETGARDVYFWSPDNRARKDALEMVYKLRGSYAVDKAHVAFSLVALAKAREGLSAPQSAPDALPPSSNTPQLPRSV